MHVCLSLHLLHEQRLEDTWELKSIIPLFSKTHLINNN